MRTTPEPGAAGAVGRAEVRRQLSALESWFALSSMTIRYTAEIEGPVDREALREALRLLCREHPMIAGRLVPGSARRADGLPDLDILSLPEDETEIRENHTGSMLVEHAKGVAYLDIARREDSTLVSFVVHHAIADGKLGAYWNTRLWSHYTDLVEGRAPAVEPRPLPKAPEALLAERGVERAQGPDRLAGVPPLDLPPPTSTLFKRESIQLTVEQTAKLHADAQALGSTVHVLVAGACAIAERRSMPLPEDVAVDISIDSPVDIRARLDPPAETWETTNALGSSEGAVRVLPTSSPVSVGAQLREQLREDLASGAVYQGILRFMDLLVTDQPRTPRITTTNMGVMAPLPVPGNLRVRDFRGWVDFDGDAIAEFFDTAHMGSYNRFTSLYLIYTYAGRLTIELGLPCGADSARAHTETLKALLLNPDQAS